MKTDKKGIIIMVCNIVVMIANYVVTLVQNSNETVANVISSVVIC